MKSRDKRKSCCEACFTRTEVFKFIPTLTSFGILIQQETESDSKFYRRPCTVALFTVMGNARASRSESECTVHSNLPTGCTDAKQRCCRLLPEETSPRGNLTDLEWIRNRSLMRVSKESEAIE